MAARVPTIETRAPTWAVGLLSWILLWSLITDFHSHWTVGSDGSMLWWLLALKMVLDHAALALAGARPYAAAILIWCAPPITIATGQLGMTMLSLPGVTVAVLALCRPWFLITHLGIALSWAVAHAVVSAETLVAWTILFFLVPATVVGLVIRYFLLRVADERERVRAATETMERVRDQERVALSRELHDAVASGLALISMETASVEESDDPGELRSALATVQQVSRATSAELRLLVRTLRDPAHAAVSTPQVWDRTAGTLASVTSRVTQALTDRGFQLTVDLEGLDLIPTDQLLPPVLHTYLRIVQESVTNVIKHGQPQAKCRVWAREIRSTLWFSLVNEVPSTASTSARCPAHDSGRMGLKGIQERAALTSGVVSYGHQGNEWVVEAALPLRPSGLA